MYKLDDVNDDPNLYLLPPYSFDDERDELLNLVKPTIFVKELEGWCTFPDWWPKLLSSTKFDEWFSYEVMSSVKDLVDNEPDRELF